MAVTTVGASRSGSSTRQAPEPDAKRAARPQTAVPGPVKVKPTAFANDLTPKLARLVEVYGVSGLAALIGVSKSQPTRWRQGTERPSAAVAKRLLGLEYLTSRLAEELTPRQTQAWFASPNPFLRGSTPAVAFTRFGGQAVEPAIAAIEVGAAV